jgi:hypothetical protein
LARGKYETVSQVQETKQVSYSVSHDEDRIERDALIACKVQNDPLNCITQLDIGFV